MSVGRNVNNTLTRESAVAWVCKVCGEEEKVCMHVCGEEVWMYVCDEEEGGMDGCMAV